MAGVNRLGEQGWELVSVNHRWFLGLETVLYFKRRKQTPATA
jgi:hypothetical protein